MEENNTLMLWLCGQMSGLPTVPPDHLLSSKSSLPTPACPKLYLHVFCICCNKLHSLLNPILRPNDDPVTACKQTRAYTGIGLKGRNVLVLDFVIKMVNSCYYKCDFLPSKNCWLSIMTEQHFLRKVWSGPSTQAQGHTLGCWWNHWLIPLHTGSRCPQCVGNWTFCPTCLAHKGAPV